jgi:hypothetical protein
MSDLKYNVEVERIKLERLGRRVIEARVFARRDAARKRRIVQCVFDHINASSSELQERLLAIINEDRQPLDTAEMEAEIAKLR